jgi:hypothetical protein
VSVRIGTGSEDVHTIDVAQADEIEYSLARGSAGEC